MVEVLHGERFETLALRSRYVMTISFSCSSHSTALPSVRISLRVFVKLVITIYTVESVAGMKLQGDHIEVLGLQTNVTFLKVKVKVRVLNFGGQLDHR